MEVTPLLNRYNRLKSARDGYWLAVWRDVRRYVMPSYSDYLTEGGARGENIFDTTAIKARERLAAGMYSWMFDPQKRNFELLPQSDELADDEEIKNHFSEVTKKITLAMANSNFSSSLVMLLNDAACGFDGICYLEDDESGALHYHVWPIETVCYSENSKGRVDTIFREQKMTARQLVQEFGKDDLPEKVLKDAGDQARQDNQFSILHAIFPRTGHDPEMLDAKNMPYADIYIELESKKVIYESGFAEIPFAVVRFYKLDNETYGRGPGIDLLPDIKMLNRMRQSYILDSEFQADPPWLVPDGSMTGKTLNRNPGSVVVYKPEMSGAKPERIRAEANLQKSYADIQTERENIKTGFYLDIFDPLGDLKQITATEAEIRNEGKLIPFAPIAGSLHSDFYSVIIHRAFGLLSRRGMLPPPPQKLMIDPQYKIDFVSKIALSIKKLQSLGWLQTEAALANVAAVKPDVMDNFKLDDVSRDIALVNGSDPGWLVPTRERDAVRQARADQMAQQAQAELLMQGAAAARGLDRAPEPGSPLSAVMTGQGV